MDRSRRGVGRWGLRFILYQRIKPRERLATLTAGSNDIMLSIHAPTAHAASLLSQLACLMLWDPRESRLESYDHDLLRAYTSSKSTLPRGHPRST